MALISPSSTRSLVTVRPSVIQGTGRNLRSMQTGRIQQYMLASLVIMILVAGLAFYLLGRI